MSPNHLAGLLEQAGHQASQIHNPAQPGPGSQPGPIVRSSPWAGRTRQSPSPSPWDLANSSGSRRLETNRLGDRSYDTFCQGGKTLQIVCWPECRAIADPGTVWR